MKRLLAATALTLCLGTPALRAAEPLSLVFISHSSPSNTFWQAVKKGFEDGCTKVQAKCQLLLTQTEGSVEQAIANMQAAVARKPDAVFVAIVDDKAYDAAVADARAKGIMVLAVNVDDSQGAAGSERQAFIGQSFVAAGYSLGKAQSKNFPKDGPIRVLMGGSAPGQTWSEQRASGVLKFMDDFKKDNPGRQVTVDKIDSGTDLAVTAEQRDNFNTGADTAAATLRQNEAQLSQAKLNLERTEVHSPVNGWVTNLLTQRGDYATTGSRALSIVDADSYWIDGYFEETVVKPIKVGDPARVWLMGFSEVIAGHVDSLARGINVSNATPNGSGLADVNPVFTWVRLAQRVPVRIHIDHVPPDVILAAGMTATVQIDPQPAPPGGAASPTGGRTEADTTAAR